jgi:hypothetical protein
MNTQAKVGDGIAQHASGQVESVAPNASMKRGVASETADFGATARQPVTTHEIEYQGNHEWLLTQWCYTHTGITYVPVKTYEVHGVSDKRAALKDAERHILSHGCRKGQWYGYTPTIGRYAVPRPMDIEAAEG